MSERSQLNMYPTVTIQNFEKMYMQYGMWN